MNRAETSSEPPRENGLVLTPEARKVGLLVLAFTFGPLAVKRKSPGLERFKETLYERCRTRYSTEFLQQDPILNGFRNLREKTPMSAEQLPCSSQKLVNTFLKRGAIPSVNTVVDAYNCVALETRLSIGAHDCASLATPVRLDLTQGGESFLGLRHSTPETLSRGEYAYFSAEDEVICRLDAVQCESTKIKSETSTALFILQGHSQVAPDFLEETADHLRKILSTHCQPKSI